MFELDKTIEYVTEKINQLEKLFDSVKKKKNAEYKSHPSKDWFLYSIRTIFKELRDERYAVYRFKAQQEKNLSILINDRQQLNSTTPEKHYLKGEQALKKDINQCQKIDNQINNAIKHTHDRLLKEFNIKEVELNQPKMKIDTHTDHTSPLLDKFQTIKNSLNLFDSKRIGHLSEQHTKGKIAPLPGVEFSEHQGAVKKDISPANSITTETPKSGTRVDRYFNKIFKK